MALANEPDCENYKQDIEAASITDSATILGIIDREMVALTSFFEVKLNALHVSYLKAKEVAHLNEHTGEIEKWQTAKHKLESVKAEDLMRIKNSTSSAHANMQELYNNFMPGEEELLLDDSLYICDDKIGEIWEIIGEADQRIKKQLADSGLPVSNIIQMEVKVSIPKEFEMMVVQNVFKAMDGGVKKSIELFYSEGMKVAAEILHNGTARLAPRVEKVNQIPDTRVNVAFQELIQQLDRYQVKIKNRINSRLSQRDFSELKWQCKALDTIAGILDCARINTELVKEVMVVGAQRFLKYTAILNYKLELVHH